MIDDSELSMLRSDVLATLPDRCDILSATLASDGMGGMVASWGTATANVRCRLDTFRGAEQVRGEAMRPYHTYVVTLPYDVSLTTAQRISIDSTVYSVTSVDPGKSWDITRRAYVERI